MLMVHFQPCSCILMFEKNKTHIIYDKKYDISMNIDLYLNKGLQRKNNS